jgi:hypothetical protein
VILDSPVRNATSSARADAVERVKQAIEEFVRHVTENEPGSRLYAAWQEAGDPTKFVTCSSSRTRPRTRHTANPPRYGHSRTSTRPS